MYQWKVAYKLTPGNRRLTHSRMNHQPIMLGGTRAVSYAFWFLWTHTLFYTPFSFFTFWHCVWGTVLTNANACRHEWDKANTCDFFWVYKVLFCGQFKQNHEFDMREHCHCCLSPAPSVVVLSEVRSMKPIGPGICSALRLKTLGLCSHLPHVDVYGWPPGKGCVVVGFWWLITHLYTHNNPCYCVLHPRRDTGNSHVPACNFRLFILLHILGGELHNRRGEAQLTCISRPKWLWSPFGSLCCA